MSSIAKFFFLMFAAVGSVMPSQPPLSHISEPAATVLTGDYSVYPLGKISKDPIETLHIEDAHSALVLKGQGWTGNGSLAGKSGSYDWMSSGGSQGRTVFDVLPGNILIGDVTGNDVDRWYWAKRSDLDHGNTFHRTWVPVPTKEARFKASYPTEPTTRTEGGIAIVSSEDHGAVFMTMAESFPEQPPEMTDRLLDAGRDGGVSNAHGTLLAERKLQVQGYPGRFIALKKEDGLVFWDCFVWVDNHLLLQAITGAHEFAANRSDMQKFIDSLEILPEDKSAK